MKKKTKKKTNKKQFVARVKAEQFAWLKREAKRSKVSIAEVMRRVIDVMR